EPAHELHTPRIQGVSVLLADDIADLLDSRPSLTIRRLGGDQDDAPAPRTDRVDRSASRISIEQFTTWRHDPPAAPEWLNQISDQTMPLFRRRGLRVERLQRLDEPLRVLTELRVLEQIDD